MLKEYLYKIVDIANRGDAREESFYSAIEGLLKEYSNSVCKENLSITTLPKKTEAGCPDFRIWDGKQHITGYIEAKHPTITNLDSIETSEQLERYLETFPNLILTNFFEFRLYRNGKRIDEVTIARFFTLEKLNVIPKVENEDKFLALLDKFLSFSLPTIHDSKSLAFKLAKRTRFLRDEVIKHELKGEDIKPNGVLDFYEDFKKSLISNLSEEDFADLYSQTITYGLFAARTRTDQEFNRKLAYDMIPRSIGILRDIFWLISHPDLPKQMECIIDDISEIIANTDIESIFNEYYHEHRGKDPIIHFYETFLAEYDPKTREKRGVYYTPEAVVSYVVRSLNIILKEYFNIDDGFANDKVTILDPAAGTLSFIAEAVKLAIKECVKKYGDSEISNFIKKNILNNFHALELMVAPYVIGHIKMALLLEEFGFKFQDKERFKLYLTNSLDVREAKHPEIKVLKSFYEESSMAGNIKKEIPILIVIGNPPYSGHSTTPSDEYIDIKTNNENSKKKKVKTWIGNLIEDYKFVDGKPLGERNPKWLQDDYVKFIRFAQWKIDQSGEGIVGFITNHSYLDNPTFRGMRRSLMRSFDRLYVIDLHGNSLKKEKCPDGSKDENVFDIQQGVAISLFIKKKERDKECKFYHSEMWGLREQKYNRLFKEDFTSTKWKEIKPKSEFYLFIPRDEKLLKKYSKFQKITDIFNLNSVGIVTGNDKFTIDKDLEALKQRIRTFRTMKIDDETIIATFKLKNKPDEKFKENRLKIYRDPNWLYKLPEILYRPFEKRYIFYHERILERPRKEVMKHMLQENIGLIFHRREELDVPYSHFLVTKNIVEHGCLSTKTTCYLAPLFVYPEKNDNDVFGPRDISERVHNFKIHFYDKLTTYYPEKSTPEEIFYYIYAVLYSNIYRDKYADFLRIDFPKIPFTKDFELFQKMAGYGKRLVDLHLLQSHEIDPPIAKGPVIGTNKVEKILYDEEKQRVYWNDEQYFEIVPKDVWEYRIGGYQVCLKWLKDRKGKVMDSIRPFCWITTTIYKTIEIQKKIDEIYSDVERITIEFEKEL
ncbi:N-6 DNA methylase [bacterium]|nr:N-6 DNA methylase [bacterium]